MRWRAAIAALTIVVAPAASGQWAVSISAETDDRFRGVSLSGGAPDLRASLGYDHPSGTYAGASAAAVELESRTRRAALLGYAGYARNTVAGLAWDVGVTATHFDAAARYDYAEFYAGLNAQRWSVRVSLSPSYFGSSARTVYAELNGSVPVGATLRAFGHAGVLAPLGHAEPGDTRRAHADARLGLSCGIGDSELRVAWVAGSRRAGLYPVAYDDRRSTWVASASWFF